MINLHVETLIQPGRCQLSAPSMHKVKTGFHVYEVYMYIAKNFCHEGAIVSPFYLLLCSDGVLI